MTTLPMGLDPPDCFGLVGVRLDGKYDVEAVVAEGGFAVVYRAVHATLRKPVAVKVLKVPPWFEGNARRAFMDRFTQEAQTLASLDHPAIVRVLDFGTSPMPLGEHAPWMVLEWIVGVTLEDDLEARRDAGGRPPVEALQLLRPIFEALASAHELGVVHRDVKPANIMLAATKGGGRAARLLDFGIAKVMDGDAPPVTGETATQTQQRSFSLYYAAPEQLMGTRTGPWTDVYALGLVLTEVLTDAPPYNGEDVSEIYVDALSERRPTPARRGRDVGAWEPVIARAVAVRCADRHANAREFLDALDASLLTEVAAPEPVHAPSRVRRNVGLAALACVVALVGAVVRNASVRSAPTAARTPPPAQPATPEAPVTTVTAAMPLTAAPADRPAASNTPERDASAVSVAVERVRVTPATRARPRRERAPERRSNAPQREPAYATGEEVIPAE